MNSFQNSFSENEKYITPSEMLEFLYCNRFIYYMNVLGVPQNEEKRYNVTKGRDMHKDREKHKYILKQTKATGSINEVSIECNEYRIRGKVDSILILTDFEYAPLDYKYSEYAGVVYDTYINQLVMYAVMIESVYSIEVTKGFILYCKNGHHLETVIIGDKEKRKMVSDIESCIKVMGGIYPKTRVSSKKCEDCCYRNICSK